MPVLPRGRASPRRRFSRSSAGTWGDYVTSSSPSSPRCQSSATAPAHTPWTASPSRSTSPERSPRAAGWVGLAGPGPAWLVQVAVLDAGQPALPHQRVELVLHGDAARRERREDPGDVVHAAD